jgi:hypothetical protein
VLPLRAAARQVHLPGGERGMSTPPNVVYLTTRERLGMPSRAAALAVACPFCRASADQFCARPRDARYGAAHPSRTDRAAESGAAA